MNSFLRARHFGWLSIPAIESATCLAFLVAGVPGAHELGPLALAVLVVLCLTGALLLLGMARLLARPRLAVAFLSKMAAWSLASIVLVLALIWPARVLGFHLLARRAESAVHAVDQYTALHGASPDALADVSGTLDDRSKNLLRSDRLHYMSRDRSARWIIFIPLGGQMECLWIDRSRSGPYNGWTHQRYCEQL